MTKKEIRSDLLRAFIAEATGRDDDIPDDVLHAMLKFSETHVAWTTIVRVLSLTAPFVEQRHGDEKRTAAENEKSHRQLQEAIAPGLKAGRAERLFKDEMVRSGFYRFKN